MMSILLDANFSTNRRTHNINRHTAAQSKQVLNKYMCLCVANNGYCMVMKGEDNKQYTNH